MDYLKEYADYAYITSNDNAAEDPNAIAQELKEYLGGKIPSTIIVDRVEAIKKAIIDSKENDLIFISGRGNRRVFCESANSIKLIKDREIVEEVIYELGW
jgi:UDP-N-acetylmuramyl tripeptide synthase